MQVLQSIRSVATENQQLGLEMESSHFLKKRLARDMFLAEVEKDINFFEKVILNFNKFKVFVVMKRCVTANELCF